MESTGNKQINTQRYWNKRYKSEYEVNRARFDWTFDQIKNLEWPLILDVGCGKGEFFKMLWDKNYKFKPIGLDITKKLSDDFTFVQASADQIPYGDNTFDFVNCQETLEHCSDIEKVISELFRVCKITGLVCISTPNQGNNESPEHMFRFNTEDFKKWGYIVNMEIVDENRSIIALFRKG